MKKPETVFQFQQATGWLLMPHAHKHNRNRKRESAELLTRHLFFVSKSDLSLEQIESMEKQ